MKKRISMCLVFGLVVFAAGSVWGFTEGDNNSFFGIGSGENNTGINNSFFGKNVGKDNSGNFNVFFGYESGKNNSIGHSNSFFGHYAGWTNNSGHNNSFFGYEAGFSNSNAYQNSFFGAYAGYSNNYAIANSFFGFSAGRYNVSGSSNTFIGNQAGYSNIIGSGNLFLGFRAGYNETGSNKLYVSNSDTSTPLIYGEFDNQYLEINGTMFASSVTFSDARYKKDVMSLEPSLAKVKLLQGVTYAWKTEEYSGKGFKEGRHIGLIAQDVEKVLPELVYTDRNGYKAVAYDKIVPVLIEAIKELNKKVEGQKKIIVELQTALQHMKDKGADLAQTN